MLTPKPAATDTPRRGPAPLVVESVGQPVALSSLAKLLLRLHQQPPLRLVKTDEQSSRAVPEIE